jgi:opacity protein-like surface antigen
MKKVLSVLAVSAFVLTAGVAFAGGPGKKSEGCPAACQQQIDDLNSSQAQQNEQLGAHGKQLANHEGRIKTLETNAYNAWYVRVGGRATWEQADFDGLTGKGTDVGWGGALAVGRQFGQFRTELEAAYQKASISKFDVNYGQGVVGHISGDLGVTTVMVNGYYEVPVADAFSVYGMVGLGAGYVDLEPKDQFGTFNTPGTAAGFAYKAGLGVSYAFTEQIAGDLGYEYLGVGTDNFTSHNIVGSVRFKF